ncbi:hypothetical protein BLNAU_4974 [Blattamonas nauphoetae]|uniref:Uncharacterized protein n=1 Tax=Blattamonas nauphoetae TaxID=2049346 RepID=A0ABQ9Y8L4_9EUKA|nr:hypothetical protein BLNAU_4974 [Blattamonas nauphoetae]
MTRRSCLTGMTPTRFCGLSSDVGNALIAGMKQLVLQQVTAVPQRAHIPKRKGVSTETTTLVLMSILNIAQTDEDSERTAASTLCVLHRMKLLDDEFKPIIATVAAEVGNGEDNEKSDALQALTYLSYRAARFLKNLEPIPDQEICAEKLVTDLVPSPVGSHSGFVDIAAALSFLCETTNRSPLHTKLHLMEFVDLTYPSNLLKLGITTAVDAFNHREMIFQKAVLPSSQFVTFLISNRYILSRDLCKSFMYILANFIDLCPFHRPTLEFVLASPIVMGFSTNQSLIEDCQLLNNNLILLNYWLTKWKEEEREVAQSGKRIIQALISEGFEDSMEQWLKYEMDGNPATDVVNYCLDISKKLGSNMEFTENDDEEESEDDDDSLE